MPLLRIFLSILTIALLIALVYHADVSALWDTLSNISFSAIASGLVLVQLQIIISALRWRFTSRRLGRDIRPLTAISEYYVANFLNQTLPGGVGGDVIRAWRMRGEGNGAWRKSAKAVMFERFSGQIAFFLLAFMGLMIWPSVTGLDAMTPRLIYTASALILLALIIALAVKYTKALQSSSLADEIADVFFRLHAWLFQCCASVLIVSTYVVVFFIAAEATGSELPWTATLTIIPFCLVAMLIPTGFGGWGTREAAAMALWPMLGATASDGLAASLTYGFLSLAGTTPGLVFLLAGTLRKHRRSR